MNFPLFSQMTRSIKHLATFFCILLMFSTLALIWQAINPDEQAVRDAIQTTFAPPSRQP